VVWIEGPSVIFEDGGTLSLDTITASINTEGENKKRCAGILHLVKREDRALIALKLAQDLQTASSICRKTDPNTTVSLLVDWGGRGLNHRDQARKEAGIFGPIASPAEGGLWASNLLLQKPRRAAN